MDSDCLIKLVKSSLKEVVCRTFHVAIPPLVKKEVVEDSADQPDAAVVRDNLEKKLLVLSKEERPGRKGEEAVFAVFESGGYDAICTDDKRFIKRLRLFGAPYITPAVLIALLLKKSSITCDEALRKLESLSPLISEEEYNTVKTVLDNWRPQ